MTAFAIARRSLLEAGIAGDKGGQVLRRPAATKRSLPKYPGAAERPNHRRGIGAHDDRAARRRRFPPRFTACARHYGPWFPGVGTPAVRSPAMQNLGARITAIDAGKSEMAFSGHGVQILKPCSNRCFNHSFIDEVNSPRSGDLSCDLAMGPHCKITGIIQNLFTTSRRMSLRL